jgi:peptidoglycan/LPS O-acetylase OafA/YrhL
VSDAAAPIAGDHVAASVPRRLDGFDGLRAIAAVLVIAYHAGSLAGATSAGAFAPLAAGLKAGVAIFFVISGFLLYLPYARAIDAGETLPNWRDFALRRAVRILPGYWVALAVLATTGLVSGVLTPDWWRFFGFAQIYDQHTLRTGLAVAWSLDVEVTFYALLPALAWMLARVARSKPAASRASSQLGPIVALAIGSLALRALLARSLLAPVPDARIVSATSLPGLMDWFAVGMGLAVARVGLERGSRVSPVLVALARNPGRCWLGAAAIYMIGVPAQRGELFLSSYGVVTHLAFGLAAGLLVLPAVLPAPVGTRSSTHALICSRPFAWLGTISYGIYLWHVAFLVEFDKWIGTPRGVLAFAGLLVVTLVGAISLGAASWYLVERPAHSWWSRRRRRADVQRLALAVGD